MPISAALGSSALLPAGLGFRNKIINGNMVVNQRSTSATTSGGFAVDRWFNGWSHPSTFTGTQSSDAPSGFTNSYLITIGTGSATVDATTANVQQRIEGYNVADCGFGTSWSKQMALSFWVKASIAGTYCVALRNSAVNRFYILEYTINVQNTWEYKTLSFLPDTTGTWEKTTNAGLHLIWQIAKQSVTASAGVWQATAVSTSNQTHLAGTNGATFYLTGVQLEQNYQPTPFEQRPYAIELDLCKRYYFSSYPQGDAAGKNYSGTVITSCGAPILLAKASESQQFNWVHTMRSAPSVTYYSLNGTSGNSSWAGSTGSTTYTDAAIPYSHATINGWTAVFNEAGSATGWYVVAHFVASSEL